MTRLICRPQGSTIYEMARSLGKDVKTARNRLRELTFMFPLYSEPDPDNGKIFRYKILSYSKADFYLPDMNFSEEDVAVFKMLMGSTDMTPALKLQAKRLFNKLTLMASERGALIKYGANEPIPIINAHTVLAKNVENKDLSKKINALLKSIADKTWLELTYHKITPDNTYDTEFYPLMVFISRHNPYVYGYNKNEEIRMLAVDRIIRINGCHSGSKPSCNMALLNNLLTDPFGISCESKPYQVKLLIDSYQAPYEKEKLWPKGKVSFEDTDEGTIMTAITHTKFEVQRYILKRTPHIKVLEPEWLMKETYKNLVEGVNRYND